MKGNGNALGSFSQAKSDINYRQPKHIHEERLNFFSGNLFDFKYSIVPIACTGGAALQMRSERKVL